MSDRIENRTEQLLAWLESKSDRRTNHWPDQQEPMADEEAVSEDDEETTAS